MIQAFAASQPMLPLVQLHSRWAGDMSESLARSRDKPGRARSPPGLSGAIRCLAELVKENPGPISL